MGQPEPDASRPLLEKTSKEDNLSHTPQPQSAIGGQDHGEGSQITPAWLRRLKSCITFRFLGVVGLVMLAAGSLMNSLDLTWMESDDLDNTPDIDPSTLVCPPTFITRKTKTFEVDFGQDKSLFIKEQSEYGRTYPQLPDSLVHVSGAVLFRHAWQDSPASSALTVDVAVSDDRLRVRTKWSRSEGSLRVIIPQHIDWQPPAGERPCVKVTVTAWVPHNSTLRDVTVKAVHLDVKLLGDLSLSVGDTTNLASVVGSIISASRNSSSDKHLFHAAESDVGGIRISPAIYRFRSSTLEAHTISGPILGIWPMSEKLELESRSGDVRVAIEPQKATYKIINPGEDETSGADSDSDSEEDDRANHAYHGCTKDPFRYRDLPFSLLRIHTVSGAITALEPIHLCNTTNIPPRDYRVDLITTSGDVRAKLAFGHYQTNLQTVSGPMNLELLPVLNKAAFKADLLNNKNNNIKYYRHSDEGRRTPHPYARLYTSTTSGPTDIYIHEPFWVSDDDDDNNDDNNNNQPSSTTTSSPSYNPFSTQQQVKAKQDKDTKQQRPYHLIAQHTSTSSPLRLTLPASWEGEIDLSTLSGTLEAGGKGVRVIKNGRGWWPGTRKELVARKGDDEQKAWKVRGSSTSGDLEVWVGRKEKKQETGEK